MDETTLPIPSLSVEALLARRDAAVKCLERVRDAVAEYEELGRLVGLKESYTWEAAVSGRGHSDCVNSPRWFEGAVDRVNSALWDHLMDLSGNRTFLDAKAREDWDKGVKAGNLPPLTEDNVRATFAGLFERRKEFFERGVVALFRGLSWDWKSNKPQKFGKRLVLTGVLDAYGFASTYGCDKLDDLVRACHVLDGKPEPDHRRGVYRSVSDSKAYEDGYIRVKTFKNGNGHVYFLRPDLVDQLNLILHRHYPEALPAETAA